MTKTPTPMQQTTGAEDIDDRGEAQARAEDEDERKQYLGGKEVTKAQYLDDTEQSVRVTYVDGSAETLPADAPALEKINVEAASENTGETIDADTGEPVDAEPEPEPTVDADTGEEVEQTGPTTTKDVTKGGDDARKEIDQREDEGR
jgi:hypothetical protein